MKGSKALQAMLTVVVVATLTVSAYYYGTVKGAVKLHPVSFTTGKKVVYLTFDDGPTPGYTNLVLADLQKAGAHATFFEIGEFMPGQEKLIASLINAGDEIGDHSYTHPNFASQVSTYPQAYAEIAWPARWLQQHLGYKVTMFRYPYGDPSHDGAEACWALGLDPEWWNYEATDWNPKVSDASIVAGVMKAVRPGFVIGLHDGAFGFYPFRGGQQPGYLPTLLADLKAQGYSFGVLHPGQAHPRFIGGGD